MRKRRTYLYGFIRDDGSDVDVTFTLTPYYPATGPTLAGPGSPAEEATIDDLNVYACGEEIDLTDAEYERLEAEIYALPPDHYAEEER